MVLKSILNLTPKTVNEVFCRKLLSWDIGNRLSGGRSIQIVLAQNHIFLDLDVTDQVHDPSKCAVDAIAMECYAPDRFHFYQNFSFNSYLFVL